MAGGSAWPTIRLENRPGGGTNIATETVVRAPPDGYTLLLVGAANAINATLYDKLNFNFLQDIAPVGAIVDSPEVFVVHPSIPAKTIPELIAYAKANPGKLSMASPGVGSGPHMSGELFKSMAGINMTHVPYRGGAPALTDVIGGQVLAAFTAPVLATEHIRAGKVRALAVTSATRSHVFPDVPTMAEAVPGYRSGAFFGIGAPKATPSAIIDALNRQINAALAEPEIRARFEQAGVSTLGGSPADFGKFIADETEKWAKVIRAANIKAGIGPGQQRSKTSIRERSDPCRRWGWSFSTFWRCPPQRLCPYQRPVSGRAARLACATQTSRRAAHSITSSTIASTPDGIVRPSALAVLRLMEKSNFVGCRTGRLAGLSPLIMRPV
jgi:tripartite-type tricarboxylate transporter receptor subunit TctC